MRLFTFNYANVNLISVIMLIIIHNFYLPPPYNALLQVLAIEFGHFGVNTNKI